MVNATYLTFTPTGTNPLSLPLLKQSSPKNSSPVKRARSRSPTTLGRQSSPALPLGSNNNRQPASSAPPSSLPPSSPPQPFSDLDESGVEDDGIRTGEEGEEEEEGEGEDLFGDAMGE